MPTKYHIHSKPMPPRKKPIGKYGIVDWREDCSSCHNCVKRECAYSVYDSERDRLHNAQDYMDYLYECKGCLCCVQSCTKGLLTWEENPEYLMMGNEVWTPDIISSTWFQAESGKIPVSGAGYPGPFRGPGFDSILTDMSEIVRPTRDGIHGREYISTSADIGRKPMKLEFDDNGNLLSECSNIVEVPLPVVFNLMPWHRLDVKLLEAFVDAAEHLGTLAITDVPVLMNHKSAIPHYADGSSHATSKSGIIEWVDAPNVVDSIKKAKAANPDLIAAVKLPLGSASLARAVELAGQGVDAFHVYADWKGYIEDAGKKKHISIAVREVHQAFVKAGCRDTVTLIASGGISLAEHVVKTILCGADLVAIDVPLMIALECKVCQRCLKELSCPIDIEHVGADYAVQRVVNLMGAWHSQMLEMMGAMGIREARRLRGETGRAMFFDDLEKECFGPIFGKLKVEVS